ncbi:MAG TPA: hypothetical protein P5571_10600 [Candidatus Krumholzibacteria bacterium]|nr:hypothetical protein [Candidatus Krumholzibacteria bacterium]
MRHVHLLLILALAAPAAADTFEAVSPSHAVFFSPVGATADAMGGGMAAAWDEPGSAYWGPARPGAPADGVELGWNHQADYADLHRTTLAMRADWRRATVSLLHDDWGPDRMEITTAFQPQGTGEFYDLDAVSTVLAVSVETRRWRGPQGDTALSLGAGFRSHRRLVAEFEDTWNDVDAGAVLAYRAHDPRAVGLRAWSVGVAATALGGDDMVLGVDTFPSQGHRRVGGRVEWAPSAEPANGRTLLLLTGTLDWQRVRQDGWLYDADWLVGAEVLWLEAVAFRYGWRDFDENRGLALGGTSFGFGLRHALLDGRLLLRADMTVIDLQDTFVQDTLELYALRAGWSF